ncbi:hypothetical protein ABT324_08400 [Saccharopolyspora sp. NPDC000359]|uniref:hypothetical protein n=1 Tax=Saccharopolyspora sp. NPDC000359 TaxID=3154251 RepID=UPI00332EB878
MDGTFTAELRRSPEPGGWTYVVWPRSVEHPARAAWWRSAAPWATARTSSR